MTHKHKKVLELLSRQISNLTGYIAQLLVLVNKAHLHSSYLPYVLANVMNHEQADFGLMPVDAVTPDEAPCPAVCCPSAEWRRIVCGMHWQYLNYDATSIGAVHQICRCWLLACWQCKVLLTEGAGNNALLERQIISMVPPEQVGVTWCYRCTGDMCSPGLINQLVHNWLHHL